MAKIIQEPSRTFSEYLLLPNLTTKSCVVDNVSLGAPLCKHKRGEEADLVLNIPMASAIMQSVSDHNMAIALARAGGISFIYQSQAIEEQAEMVKRVKMFKAGFVTSDSNLKPQSTLREVEQLAQKTGHTTMAVTKDGTATGRLLGILTSRDYRPGHQSPDDEVRNFMTPFEQVVCGNEGISLSEANELIWQYKLNVLPIIDAQQRLCHLVFRKDYDDHKENPDELVDADKRLCVGAGINTHDYKERVPALIEAGADVLCIDSSDGYSEWQKDAIGYVKETFGDSIKIGAGNVVDGEGFDYLVAAGADFVKVGIGGGSICITREQKGIGRGQASAVIDVATARSGHLERTGVYVPICSDGGIVLDYQVALALAMGADWVMMGRYFARFDESPSRRLRIGGSFVKEYWGEGSNRARNWQRYEEGAETSGQLAFEEGVDVYIPYAGHLRDNIGQTLKKLRSTICNCGAMSIPEFQEKGRLTVISSTSLREGSAHDVTVKESETPQVV